MLLFVAPVLCNLIGLFDQTPYLIECHGRRTGQFEVDHFGDMRLGRIDFDREIAGLMGMNDGLGDIRKVTRSSDRDDRVKGPS